MFNLKISCLYCFYFFLLAQLVKFSFSFRYSRSAVVIDMRGIFLFTQL